MYFRRRLCIAVVLASASLSVSGQEGQWSDWVHKDGYSYIDFRSQCSAGKWTIQITGFGSRMDVALEVLDGSMEKGTPTQFRLEGHQIFTFTALTHDGCKDVHVRATAQYADPDMSELPARRHDFKPGKVDVKVVGRMHWAAEPGSAQAGLWSDWVSAHESMFDVRSQCSGGNWTIQFKIIPGWEHVNHKVQLRALNATLSPDVPSAFNFRGTVPFTFSAHSENGCKDIHVRAVVQSQNGDSYLPPDQLDYEHGKLRASTKEGRVTWSDALGTVLLGAANGMGAAQNRAPAETQDSSTSVGSAESEAAGSEQSVGTSGSRTVNHGRVAIYNVLAATNTLRVGQQTNVQFSVTHPESVGIHWSFSCNDFDIVDARSTGQIQREGPSGVSGGPVAPGSVVLIALRNRNSHAGVITCTVRAGAIGSDGNDTQAQQSLRFSVGP
jgi:hypothetical protein